MCKWERIREGQRLGINRTEDKERVGKGKGKTGSEQISTVARSKQYSRKRRNYK